MKKNQPTPKKNDDLPELRLISDPMQKLWSHGVEFYISPERPYNIAFVDNPQNYLQVT